MFLRVVTFTAVAINANIFYHILLNPAFWNSDPKIFAANNKHINPNSNIMHADERSESE